MELLPCLLVGVVWGTTNALMRKYSVDAAAARVGKGKDRGSLSSAVRSRAWMAAFAVNQLGSVGNAVVVGRTDLAVAVPVVQATTLVATSVVARCVGEATPPASVGVVVGVGLVAVGLMLMLTPPAQM